jgi:ABC-type uncharacterized transport system involved in gliding motility auxiliary subunit
MRYGTNTAVLVSAMLAVLAGLNYWAVKRDKSWDLSKDQRHSLSNQTRKVLDALKSDVTLTYFDRGNRLQGARAEQYRRASRVKTDYVDPLVNPGPARVRITGPTVLVVMGERRGKVTAPPSRTSPTPSSR